jgi:hypothetical protein
LLVYDGASGFPLAAWLRPGAIHASLGVVEVINRLVTLLRAAWPGVPIRLRSDNGQAVPELYAYCEQHALPYALGYASNAVLQRATAAALADLELYHACYGHREPALQRFESLSDYQADSWPRPRRIVAKIEVTPQGSQRRFVVTNLTEPAAVVYRDFYVQRGRIPEQPIGEMKNGLRAERLSACGFCANAFRLLVHTLAYALVVLFREAVAAVPEVATASVSTLRQRWWKVGAVLVSSARRLRLRVSATWPNGTSLRASKAWPASEVADAERCQAVPRTMKVGSVSHAYALCPDLVPPRRFLGPCYSRPKPLRANHDHPAGGPRSFCARPGIALRRLLERTQHPRRPPGARRPVPRQTLQSRHHHLGFPQPSP